MCTRYVPIIERGISSKEIYLMHMAPWCIYAHIEFGPFNSHPTITPLFSFQPSHVALGSTSGAMDAVFTEIKKR
jgi:hypothetical protein